MYDDEPPFEDSKTKELSVEPLPSPEPPHPTRARLMSIGKPSKKIDLHVNINATLNPPNPPRMDSLSGASPTAAEEDFFARTPRLEKDFSLVNLPFVSQFVRAHLITFPL